MKTIKVVINICYGGFGLSYEATLLYAKKKGFKVYPYVTLNGVNGPVTPYKPREGEIDPLFLSYSRIPLRRLEKLRESGKIEKYSSSEYYRKIAFCDKELSRTDKTLIEVIEELGEQRASGRLAHLHIVEIPSHVKYEIDYYDGQESVEEQHESWS